MSINTPDWVKHAIFYQIFPDRFARRDHSDLPKGISVKPWGSPPEEQGFQGGNLWGVIDRLDYLQALGINALYLNPIFSSAANHRYHTYDYFEVDPLLGGDAALRALLDEAHQRGIRVVLDGVFNHASRGFWAFHHILENNSDSPYVDWFIIHDWPLRPYNHQEEKNGENNSHNYAAWWDLPALPKFNTNNPGVRDYIFSVARHWLDFGIDGWRLDVPADIDDDDFWREFRDIVKSANPDAWICGEIWNDARRWLQGDMFDAVMNYIITGPSLSFFGAETIRTDYKKTYVELEPLTAPEFAESIENMLGLYDWEINLAQLNMLDSHDMARALWVLDGDKSALRLCILFLMTMPGAPCLYYGNEIGMSAADDPHCREAFPWDDQAGWDHDLLNFYQQATALRHDHSVLQTGNFQTLHAKDKLFAFQRRLDDRAEAIVIFNTDTSTADLTLDAASLLANSYRQVWPAQGNTAHQVDGPELILSLPAREALVLVSNNHGR